MGSSRSGEGGAPPSAGRAAGGALRRTALLAGLLSTFAGCVYSFSGSSLPSHIKTISIPTFGNETLQPGLDADLTEATIDAFVEDNRLNVGGLGNADAVVEGRLLGYDHSVFGVGNVDQAQEYRVTIRASVTVKDRVKGKDLWSDEAMVGQAVYRLDGTGQGPSDENAARLEAVENLAEDILSKTLEEW